LVSKKTRSVEQAVDITTIIDEEIEYIVDGIIMARDIGKIENHISKGRMHLFSLRKIKTKLKSEGFTRKNGH
jgi:hypothetical protein